MEKTMTVKEIAAAVGQTDRSVRNWVVRLAEKSSVIAEKLSASSPMHPASYTLSETCAIIEEGMGAAAADVYRTNAAMEIATIQAPKPLNGKQMEYLHKMARDGMITSEQLQNMLGVSLPPIQAPLQIEGKSSLPGKVERQIYAIAHKVAQKYFAEQAVIEATGDLFK